MSCILRRAQWIACPIDDGIRILFGRLQPAADYAVCMRRAEQELRRIGAEKGGSES